MRTPTFALAFAVLATAGCRTDKDTDSTPTESGNERPVADAGPDVSQEGGASVLLDGRGSYDPDGDTISFNWSFDRVPDGSRLGTAEAPFSDNHSTVNSTTFLPDSVGTYIVKLVVEDEGGSRSEPDYAVVTIGEGDKPVADAGDDQTGLVGATFTLDGSKSYDSEGRPLTYRWSWGTIPDGSGAALSSADVAGPSFQADLGGLYIASLVVNNGLADSDPDTVLVRVSSSDPLPPTAIAGDDQTVMDCVLATLDGSGSYDPNDEDKLSYLWSIQVKPDGSKASDDASFSDRSAVSTTFWPDVAGDYVLSLAVSDGSSWSTPDTLLLTATERIYNSEPSVEAGTNQAVDAGKAICEESGYTYDCDDCAAQTVTLGADGLVSDLDGDPYSILWEVVSGSATIADPTSLVTTAILSDAAPTEPDVCESLEYVFSLTATDCTGETSTDTLTFTVSCCGVSTTDSGSDSGARARARTGKR